MKFQYTIAHVSGKELDIPDTLSRAPLPSQLDNFELISSEEIESHLQPSTCQQGLAAGLSPGTGNDNIFLTIVDLVGHHTSQKDSWRKYWKFQRELL